jgi:hypothetical protein
MDGLMVTVVATEVLVLVCRLVFVFVCVLSYDTILDFQIKDSIRQSGKAGEEHNRRSSLCVTEYDILYGVTL